MISGVLFMCLTNIISISSSNMNNSPSSSSNNNNEADNAKESLDKILDVIFDYNGNGDDELTLRFDKRIFYKETFVFFSLIFSLDVVISWKFYQQMSRYQVHADGGQDG